MRKALVPLLLLFAVALPGLGQELAKQANGTDTFTPDPDKVLRYGKGYRYPQQGWTVVHVEGEPYERGYQHGKLMAPEIAAFVRCVAAEQGHKDPAGAWRITRTLVNSLFLRKFEKLFQRAGIRIHLGMWIAQLRKAPRNRQDRKVGWVAIGNLTPVQRSRHTRIRQRTHGIRRTRRTILRILVVVERDTVALLLPPFRGRQLRYSLSV